MCLKRKLIHDTAELIYLRGLRHGRAEGSDGPGGSGGVPLAELDAGGLNRVGRTLPRESLFPVTGRPFKEESAVKKP